jgi:hypothetical protein
MSEDAKTSPPDRLSNNPTSPHFDFEAMQRGVGVRFKDRERNDIEEYCASEGWVRVAAGKAVDRNGYPVTVKLSGPVEIWWRDDGEGGSDIAPHQHESQHLGHGAAERKSGPAGHGSSAPPPQIRKKQDRSS